MAPIKPPPFAEYLTARTDLLTALIKARLEHLKDEVAAGKWSIQMAAKIEAYAEIDLEACQREAADSYKRALTYYHQAIAP